MAAFTSEEERRFQDVLRHVAAALPGSPTQQLLHERGDWTISVCPATCRFCEWLVARGHGSVDESEDAVVLRVRAADGDLVAQALMLWAPEITSVIVRPSRC